MNGFLPLAGVTVYDLRLVPVSCPIMTVVPDLRRKFRLLITFGPCTDLDALGAVFGKRRNTLEWWADGSPVREAGRMPAEALKALLDQFAVLLPGRTEEDVRQLVLGPSAALEEAIRSSQSPSLADVIAAEGQRGTVRLHRAGNSGLVELDEPEMLQAGIPDLLLGERFALEFKVAKPGYALILQNAQNQWALVPFVNRERMHRAEAGSVHVPGLGSDGTPRYLRENRDPGLQTFIGMFSSHAFPQSILRTGQNNILLDAALLDQLARFYLTQPKSERAIHMIDVRFSAD